MGVVYGDIGTSPLYALRECVLGSHAVRPYVVPIAVVLLTALFSTGLVGGLFGRVLFVLISRNAVRATGIFRPPPARPLQRSCCMKWQKREQLAGPAADNIHAIVEVERQAARQATLGERVGQTLSNFVGTMLFVTVQTFLMATWIAWNTLGPADGRFDPYPYGLMTFIVSLEGVLIATFVLIAQNRMSRQSDQRDHLNLQISMLAEQEMTLMLKLLRRIADRLDVPPETADQARAERLTEETNVYELVRTLREELPHLHSGRKDEK